jgi:mRNA interferase HigB
VNVVSLRTLRDFWEKHPRAETPLKDWYAIASKAEWSRPSDVKHAFGTSVDFIGDNRIIFDIGGNKYRLIVRVSYRFKQVLVKFVGTHREYDDIDPETV